MFQTTSLNQSAISFSNHLFLNRFAWTHAAKVWLYMLIVFGHFSEHAIQIYQIYGLGWIPKEAGGILGLWFPGLAQAEVLHLAYNSFQLAGLLILLSGFVGGARLWWKAAIVAQSWHYIEHYLLQVQWITGIYLFGATEQMSIGQLFLPRAELHFIYNFVVFVPTIIGTILYFHQKQNTFTIKNSPFAIQLNLLLTKII
ncbi:MAG: hypothetical protein AAF702_02050 [Chloroflexota bacterium]